MAVCGTLRRNLPYNTTKINRTKSWKGGERVNEIKREKGGERLNEIKSKKGQRELY